MTRLTCQKMTPARSERIGNSFFTWTAFEKSAKDERIVKYMRRSE
jgi:hypothetical protein